MQLGRYGAEKSAGNPDPGDLRAVAERRRAFTAEKS